MTIDDKRSEFSDKLTRRINEHDHQYAIDIADLRARFRQADAAQQTRMRQQSPTRIPRFNWESPIQAQMAVGQSGVLQHLDDLMWRSFGLGEHVSNKALSRYPVVYCETLPEFFEAIHADDDLSDTERQRVIQESVTEAEANARYGGISGVNLPGRGCYLNGWLFGANNGISAREALQDARVFPKILETACHEKLGHGFIAELTAIGQEKSRLGLWRFDLAHQAALRAVDTPRGALLYTQHEHIYHSTKFTEEGWATWVEQFMFWRAAHDGLFGTGDFPLAPEVPYTREKVIGVFELAQKQAPAEAQSVLKALKALDKSMQILLIETEPQTPMQILWAINVWQESAAMLDPLFEAKMKQPSVYVLGYLLMNKLAAQIGWQNLPYAVILAGNISYQLDEISVNDLATVLHTPRLNVNTRLAMLATLTLTPEQGPADLARMAHDRLSFAIPAGW